MKNFRKNIWLPPLPSIVRTDPSVSSRLWHPRSFSDFFCCHGPPNPSLDMPRQTTRPTSLHGQLPPRRHSHSPKWHARAVAKVDQTHTLAPLEDCWHLFALPVPPLFFPHPTTLTLLFLSPCSPLSSRLSALTSILIHCVVDSNRKCIRLIQVLAGRENESQTRVIVKL